MRSRLEPGPSRRGLRLLAAAVYGVIAVAGAIAGACTTTDTTIMPATTIGPGTTSVSVEPQNFLHLQPVGSAGPVSLVCTDTPGAMQSYVATVTDQVRPCFTSADCPPVPGQSVVACVGAQPEGTNPVAGVCAGTFTLPSSPPTSCTQNAYFEFINVGDKFTAVVDGYEQPPSQLVPACGAAGPGIPPDHPCTLDADCVAAVGPQSRCVQGLCTCAADSDCPIAYGCAGQCLVTTYAGVNTACLQPCITSDGDAGASAAFWQCMEATQFCASTSVGGYLECVENCGASATCLNDAAPQYCLDNDLQLLNAPCSKADPGVTGGVPDGGVAGGEVQTCTCIYRAVEGNRQMYLQGPPYDQLLTPRWTTPVDQACGSQDPPTAQQFVDVPIQPCVGLIDNEADAGVTAIDVFPYAALGGASCTVGDFDGGSTTVTGFQVIPADASLGTQIVACSANASVVYGQGIGADQTYTFTLQAYAGAALFAESSCFATTSAPGITVYAACDPLVPFAPDAGTTGMDGG